MRILPVYLTKKTVIEMPIGVFNCERIILNKLVCHKSNVGNLQSCIVYFNGTPVRYTRKANTKKMVFHVDGIPDNIKSFHLLAPCHVQFMLDFPNVSSDQSAGVEARFILHLSLEVNSALRNVS